jgi:nitrogen-specific signal transduction histidine kinase
MWKASEMRAALAVSDARARYLKRLTVVAGGLAHEIKNPLSSLRGFAQLIGEAASPQSTAEYADLMVAELDAINRRVDGLRHFAPPSLPEFRPDDR